MAKKKGHNSMNGDELLQFIERIEQLNAEKKDILESIKEVRSEAKGRGYDTKIVDRLVKLRARDPDQVAEEEAIFELYREAIGI